MSFFGLKDNIYFMGKAHQCWRYSCRLCLGWLSRYRVHWAFYSMH